MIKFKGKRVLVYGMGTSGQAACRLLHSEGACVSFYDDEERFGNFYCYEPSPQSKTYDLVVVSPGIKVNGNEIISHFLLAKTPVISELDLGYLFIKGKVIGITGTNGKTTTTMLLGQILKEAGYKTFVCGNVGLPITSIAKQTTRDSITVCEVSNFQLELSNKFHADYATILNLAPDHIDRHGNFEEYVRVKKKIISPKHQRFYINFDDELVRDLRAKKNSFYSLLPLNKGVFVKNNCIYHNKTRIISCTDIPLVGNKNIQNVLVATAIARDLHVKPKVIRSAISEFVPPKHRLQMIGKLSNGAVVVDDSKATNVSSVDMALESLKGQDIVLLMGGLNKDCDFAPFFSKRYPLARLICFGSAGEELSSLAKCYGYEPEVFATMKEATLYARVCAEEGQVVLLSPGCASFDEFSSYAVRGEIFKELMFEELTLE